MSYADRIKPNDKSINTYLDDLLNKNYQIPTFQREVVWQKENVKKLWDSIFKFYPLGSVLIWKTGIKLQNHRKIGGHLIDDPNFQRIEYQYILDGQQRTTSLLTSIFGGTIEGRPGFNPSLYVDMTIEEEDDTDDDNWVKRFLFWDEIDDRNGELKRNIGRKKKYDEGLIVQLKDVKDNFGSLERRLVEHKSGEYTDYDHPVRENLRGIKQILDNYRISLIELRDIQVAQVCQIFERINQEGKPLNIFDIVVAKTFRPQDNGVDGFYLREIVDKFRETNESRFLEIDDLTYLQMLAVLIYQKDNDCGIQNITDRYLNNVKAEQIEDLWASSQTAFLKTFDFFENHLRMKGPQLVPYRYFYMTLTSYFFENANPDYDFLKQYFWYYSAHNDDLLSNTTHMWKHIEKLTQKRNGEIPEFDRFLIDRDKLRTASYSSRGRLSRVILSLYANQDPRDWRNPDRSVLADVYYILTDKPNLHHIFPLNYITNNPGNNKLDSNSLMNIAYLTQLTNIQISDKNPVDYIKEFDNLTFEAILPNHILTDELLQWARMDEIPDNALDTFIEKRIDNIIELLKDKIKLASFEIVDTKGQEKEAEQPDTLEVEN